ncbi:hypothetical protein [Aeromicrobium sp. CTD01-1L150]|uniref:hypothetical protein n=1 Tax=Aeromicrobium sp. CTD01-1L150 TaxID=3341830 RepID=UPI0035C043EC
MRAGQALTSAAARWSVTVAGAVLLAGGGLVGVVLVRLDVLAARPWGYLALTAGVIGAVCGLVLAVVRARALTKQ